MEHISVLLNETVDSLNIKEDGIYVDMTLGGGGHAREVLKRLKNGKLIGIDQDEYAINRSKENLKDFNNVIYVKDNYLNIDNILKSLKIDRVDGIYMDIGVSSFQFDDPDRGFSYNYNSKLDMRMDREKKLDAYTIVNEFDEKELYHIIKNYGEEQFAKNIAKHICIDREIKKIETTFELVDIIKKSIPAKMRVGKHPAKRTFQALRIYVNDELNVLETTIDKAAELLKDKGRLAIISFHSLEDRIVKNKFKLLENPCTCDKRYPCICGKKSKGIVVTKKPIVSSEDEINNNNRAHSAKLRVFERIRND